MKFFLNRFKFTFILIPVALFISFLDKKIISGFLSSNEIPDHYLFIGSLLVVIITLIYVVLRFDKNTNSWIVIIKNSLHVIEINARFTSSLLGLQEAYGDSVTKKISDLYLTKVFDKKKIKLK